MNTFRKRSKENISQREQASRIPIETSDGSRDKNSTRSCAKIRLTTVSYILTKLAAAAGLWLVSNSTLYFHWTIHNYNASIISLAFVFCIFFSPSYFGVISLEFTFSFSIWEMHHQLLSFRNLFSARFATLFCGSRTRACLKSAKIMRKECKYLLNMHQNTLPLTENTSIWMIKTLPNVKCSRVYLTWIMNMSMKANIPGTVLKPNH